MLDTARLAQRWPVPGPRRLRATTAGVHNQSVFVDTPSRSFVPRQYTDTRPEAVAYEHALLIDQDIVSAVLDFEFAGHDLHAIDLAVGLTWSTLEGNASLTWDILDAFASSYTSAAELTDAEAAAIPSLAMLRFAYGLVLYIGRDRAGLAGADAPARCIAQRAMRFLLWLDDHELRFRRRLQTWASGSNRSHSFGALRG